MRALLQLWLPLAVTATLMLLAQHRQSQRAAAALAEFAETSRTAMSDLEGRLRFEFEEKSKRDASSRSDMLEAIEALRTELSHTVERLQVVAESTEKWAKKGAALEERVAEELKQVAHTESVLTAEWEELKTKQAQFSDVLTSSAARMREQVMQVSDALNALNERVGDVEKAEEEAKAARKRENLRRLTATNDNNDDDGETGGGGGGGGIDDDDGMRFFATDGGGGGGGGGSGNTLRAKNVSPAALIAAGLLPQQRLRRDFEDPNVDVAASVGPSRRAQNLNSADGKLRLERQRAMEEQGRRAIESELRRREVEKKKAAGGGGGGGGGAAAEASEIVKEAATVVSGGGVGGGSSGGGSGDANVSVAFDGSGGIEGGEDGDVAAAARRRGPLGAAVAEGGEMTGDDSPLYAHLDDRTFGFVTAQGGYWLVAFVSPTSERSNALLRYWNVIAYRLARLHIKVGVVDASKSPGLKERFNLTGYPRIFFIHKSRSVFFQDKRTIENLISFAVTEARKIDPELIE